MRSLPRPTGPYGVGFLDYEWVPQSIQSSISSDTPRSAYSLARLYYPSSLVSSDDKEYEKSCGSWMPSPAYHQGYGHFYLRIPKLLSIPASKFFAGHVKIWAVEDAPLVVSDRVSAMPVVLFSHGLAGIRTTYSSVCCELASHGFLVAALEHRYTNFAE